MCILIALLVLFSPIRILATLNGPCFVEDTPGVCLPTAKCRAGQGTPTKYYCKGDPTDVQCCTKTSCNNGGNCRFNSQCFGGTSISGYCPGPSDFRCCLDQQPPDFPLYGVNEAGAEFGEKVIPGTLNTDYKWPEEQSIQFFIANGMNAFRIPFLAERMIDGGLNNPSQLAGNLDQNYLGAMKNVVNFITGQGAYAIIEPHNYGWYPNYEGFKDSLDHTPSVIDPLQFKTFWNNLATQFKDNRNVIFDTNNEFADMSDTDVFNLNQAAIEGIREAGATAQLILIEGNDYTSALHWVDKGGATLLANLQDPSNNIAYEMHQYLNQNEDGKTPDCIWTNPNDYLQEATKWCESNQKLCFLGEIGTNAQDPVCAAAIVDLLNYIRSHRVWIGALWWWAGSWWGQNLKPGDKVPATQYLCVEPAYGNGDNQQACPNHQAIMDILNQFQRLPPILDAQLKPDKEQYSPTLGQFEL